MKISPARAKAMRHATENAARQNRVARPNPTNRVRFDDIVVSTESIGPIQKQILRLEIAAKVSLKDETSTHLT